MTTLFNILRVTSLLATLLIRLLVIADNIIAMRRERNAKPA